MNKLYFSAFLYLNSLISVSLHAQVEPLNSPYNANGTYSITTETLTDASPALLTYRPTTGQSYPVLLFQPGANGFFENNINVNSYDIYMQHLASYGYVVVIIDNTQGGPNNTLFANVHDRLKNFANNTNHWMHDAADLSKLIVGGHSNGGLNATKLILSRPNEVHGIVYMASYPNPGAFGSGADDVSGYIGNIFLMIGNEDATSIPLGGTTNATALEAYNSKFQSANCKTFVEFSGVGHAGFGDYPHDSQTVGTLGREAVTASIRHYLVTFMERTTKQELVADQHFLHSDKRLTSVASFLSNCTEIQNNTSISSIDLSGILVYPNPMSDWLHVDFPNFSSSTRIELINNLGQIIYSEIGTQNFSVENIGAGMYQVHIDKRCVGFVIK